MNITIKKVTSINEFIDAIRLRVDVFIIEQKCPPGWEPDELDKNSQHFIAVVEDSIVATARLREDPKGVAKIERLVVKKEYRKKGIGEKLILTMVQHSKKQGNKKVWIQAQVQAKPFFEKLGFKTVSKEYDLWNLGILHVDMEYIFPKKAQSS